MSRRALSAGVLPAMPRTAVLVAVLSFVVFEAAPAAATTVTLGPALLGTNGTLSGFQCDATCDPPGANTIVQTSRPGVRVTAPSAGRITAWRVRGTAATGGSIKFVILDVSGLTATSTAISPAAAQLNGTPNPVDIPIGAGQRLGVSLARGGGLPELYGGPAPSATSVRWSSPGFTDANQTWTAAASGAHDILYDYNADVVLAPNVSGVSPSSSRVEGGTQITISGQYLDGATGVSFGEAAASDFTVFSPTQIRATAPPGTNLSTVDVTVTGPGGASARTSKDRLLYENPPVVTGLSPASGPAAGGTQVMITGSNFYAVSRLTFGGAPSSLFVVDSPEQIRAAVPSGAAGTSVDVQVATAVGTSAASPSARFTYGSPPRDRTAPLYSTAPPDRAPPRLTGLALSPRTFTPAKTGASTAGAKKVGTRVSYRLDEPATATFIAKRKKRGIKLGKRCVPSTTKALRLQGKRTVKCDILSRVTGSFVDIGVAGANTVRFAGRLSGKSLAPGRYRLVAVARDSTGNVANPVTSEFTALRSPRNG